MRPSLVLALALVAPGTALAGPFDFFEQGAGTVEIDGTVEVPLLRGVDTDALPKVLATGSDADDEFLMGVVVGGGPNQCTEAVVGALGGWVKEYTMARQGKLFGRTTKLVVKGGYIPEIRIGDLVLRDVHCEISPEDNDLSLPVLPQLAAAILPSQGVVRFAPSSEADALLSAVGEVVQGERLRGGVSWFYDKKVMTPGAVVAVPATVLGHEGRFLIEPSARSEFGTSAGEPPWVDRRDGLFYTAGAATVGGVELPVETWVVNQDAYRPFPTREGILEPLDGVIGTDALVAVDLAIDGGTGRVALAPVEQATWEDPGDKLLEDAREAYEGDDDQALLQPTRLGDRVLAELRAVPSAETCTAGYEVIAPSTATVQGIRMLGASARSVVRTDCVEEVQRAEEPADATSTDGTADASPASSGDKKEASRKADYADALWKHGRYDEALDLYAEALDDAGEDCSFYEDFASKAIRRGRTDEGLAAAMKAGELYDKWASQDLQIRLQIQNGELVPGAYTEAQADVCHKAWGYAAEANLVRGSHSKVAALYDKHMDLDEDLALAQGLSHLQQDRPDLAHGVLLQALNVGGREDVGLHLALALTAAERGRDVAAEGNLEQFLEDRGALSLADGLAALEVARRIDGQDRATRLAADATELHPDDPAAWTLRALEARRTGDEAVLADVAERAGDLADLTVWRDAGTAGAWCRAAALHAAAGDLEAASEAMGKAEGRPGFTTDCHAAPLVVAAVQGEPQAIADGLQGLAVRRPGHLLGTLSLFTPLPGASADADDGTQDDAGE